MKAKELRTKFLKYFERNGHTIVRSSPLVPINDPTLLFTNAGMNQFKDVFLGLRRLPFKRATSSQKCVRAGGKHNDLENVGYTLRHHTFFEMLGNFSFGDYFKEEAIKFAFDFLVNELNLDKERMAATIFKGEDGIERDDEAYNIWLKYFPKEKIFEFGKKDNFWSMGDVGPCGPCSEIHYFQGNHLPCEEEKSGRECKGVECECDRWIELWNLVFMQFNRDENGNLTPLPAPCVDTGMGLERLASVVQGVYSNYDSDLFKPLISLLENTTNIRYGDDFKSDVALRVISDHIRSSSFLIADGVVPSNEGRGYVLRKIIRRAIRFERKLGIKDSILPKLTEKLTEMMGEDYPELYSNLERIKKILLREEEIFTETLEVGISKLESYINTLKGGDTVDGDFLFKLYDTYGFPLDLAKDITAERKLKLDIEGFEAAMEKQREKAKSITKRDEISKFSFDIGEKVEFIGYDRLESQSKVIVISDGNEFKTSLKAKEKGFVVFSPTPFYGEGGGQVGDTGKGESQKALFRILDTKKDEKAQVFSIVEVVEGELSIGDEVFLEVDKEKRRNTEAHHTATHILHYALREILGSHCKQAGSYVSPEKLRFDFQHFSPLNNDLISAIEEKVNSVIFADHPVKKIYMPLDDALKYGAIALFDEKYGDLVRVVEIEGVSKELCGGCHVDRTSKIGIFKIIDERSVASGIRRIEAVCQLSALLHFEEYFNMVKSLEEILKVEKNRIGEIARNLIEEKKKLEKEIESLKVKIFLKSEEEIKVEEINGIKILGKFTENLDSSLIKNLTDTLREKIGSGIVVIGNSFKEKVSIVVAVTDDLKGKIDAVKIVKEIGKIIGGGGGGRWNMAEAGGKNVSMLREAMTKAFELIKNNLNQ